MKLIRNLKRKLNNHGSSIIMVIVALSFIGIIVGSLLSAAGSAYTLKRQELNAKDNFYYVEQAMQEIYTGVGMQTIEEMKTAYAYTLENMVRFDTDLQTYKTLSDEEANQMFKEKFVDQIMNSDYFKRGAAELAVSLQGYISNATVKLDASKLSVIREGDRIVLKDVTVTREQEYDTNAGGTYTQTVSADIVISQPDFDVQFNVTDIDYSALFDFALVGDMGVEIKKTDSLPLVINGNIYAASDYYNKTYNSSDYENGDVTAGEKTYTFARTTNKQLKAEGASANDYSPASGYVNDYQFNPAADAPLGQLAPFDGVNEHSRYSGLYIDGSSVSIMATTLIIPGSLSVMNGSSLNVYNRSGASLPQIWADDIVLGGSSKYDSESKLYKGSSAIFRADLFVKDDLQLDADGTSFTLVGSYYGYGNGASADERVFFESVTDRKAFEETINDKTYNRGHFNSSAIVVNGQNATLDFSAAENIYVAGRAYVELSRYGKENEKDGVKTTTYTYNPTTTVNGETDYISDYKTGESIAYKPSQLLYTVSTWDPAPENEYGISTGVEIPTALKAADSLGQFFPEAIFGGYMPTDVVSINGRDYSFIDFVGAWSMIHAYSVAALGNNPKKAAALEITSKYDSMDDYQTAFAVFYFAESQKEDANPALFNIAKYDGFEYGEISYTASTDGSVISPTVYSSGAITVNKGNTFTMTAPNDETAIAALLSGNNTLNSYSANVVAADSEDSGLTVPENLIAAAYDISNDLVMEANYVKWNLSHSIKAEDKAFVNGVISEAGEDVITPLNKYILFNNYSAPKASLVSHKIDKELSNGTLVYRIWASDEDVVVSGDTEITGIVVTKGDVSFDSKVEKFTGIIISGGKIYVGEHMTEINAAPATCREIIRQCMRTDDDDCRFFLQLFSEYEKVVTGATSGEEVSNEVTPMVNVNSIGFSDVCSMENWTKNVGGAYEVTN